MRWRSGPRLDWTPAQPLQAIHLAEIALARRARVIERHSPPTFGAHELAARKGSHPGNRWERFWLQGEIDATRGPSWRKLEERCRAFESDGSRAASARQNYQRTAVLADAQKAPVRPERGTRSWRQPLSQRAGLDRTSDLPEFRERLAACGFKPVYEDTGLNAFGRRVLFGYCVRYAANRLLLEAPGPAAS